MAWLTRALSTASALALAFACPCWVQLLALGALTVWLSVHLLRELAASRRIRPALPALPGGDLSAQSYPCAPYKW